MTAPNNRGLHRRAADDYLRKARIPDFVEVIAEHGDELDAGMFWFDMQWCVFLEEEKEE